jgi:hypothetical protein
MRHYRDTMTSEETAALLAESDALDAAYAAAAALDAAEAAAQAPVDPEEAAAAEEQSLDYFNRFVAGDRR